MTLWDKEKYKPETNDEWLMMKSTSDKKVGGRKPGKTLGIWMQLNKDYQCRLRRQKILLQCDTWQDFVIYVLEMLEE